jgi:hypothetical protein
MSGGGELGSDEAAGTGVGAVARSVESCGAGDAEAADVFGFWSSCRMRDTSASRLRILVHRTSFSDENDLILTNTQMGKITKTSSAKRISRTTLMGGDGLFVRPPKMQSKSAVAREIETRDIWSPIGSAEAQLRGECATYKNPARRGSSSLPRIALCKRRTHCHVRRS